MAHSTQVKTEAQDHCLRSTITAAFKDVLPVIFAVIPFSMVFGAVAVEQGLSVGQVVLASATIFAGASQYVMIDLMASEVPAWSVVLSVIAINFRHVLYSASIGRHFYAFSGLQKAAAFFMLTDPQYAASEARELDQGLRPAYYFAYALAIYSTWMACNITGAFFGSLITSPEKFGVDLILPLYFTGLVAGFHSRADFIQVLLVSCGVSWLVFFTLGSPWHITCGGLAGMATAALLSTPANGTDYG